MTQLVWSSTFIRAFKRLIRQNPRLRPQIEQTLQQLAEEPFHPYFSRDLENLSPNLSPKRREALIFPPSLIGKGVRGLGFS